jgi:predicted trehalose synthase
MEGTDLLQRTRAELALVLGVMVLEKSVYELDYELSMRPDWVTVPIRSILAQLGAGAG